jgi:hypothetical protein
LTRSDHFFFALLAAGFGDDFAAGLAFEADGLAPLPLLAAVDLAGELLAVDADAFAPAPDAEDFELLLFTADDLDALLLAAGDLEAPLFEDAVGNLVLLVVAFAAALFAGALLAEDADSELPLFAGADFAPDLAAGVFASALFTGAFELPLLAAPDFELPLEADFAAPLLVFAALGPDLAVEDEPDFFAAGFAADFELPDELPFSESRPVESVEPVTESIAAPAMSVATSLAPVTAPPRISPTTSAARPNNDFLPDDFFAPVVFLVAMIYLPFVRNK